MAASPFTGSADVIVRLRFLATSEGGRQAPIQPDGPTYGCPFFFQGAYFDCRLLLDECAAPVAPGDTVEVALKFLSPKLIKPRLAAGSTFRLWEGHFVAEGTVLEILG